MFVALLWAVLSSSNPVVAQQLSELSLPPGGNGASQRAEVSQWVGLVKITIAYHSPSVRRNATDRTGHIWGELVPYGLFDEGLGPSRATPWRAGADETTTISVSHDVKIGDRDLKAGTYGLFLEAQATGSWSWIFSRDAVGWGSYQYDPTHDVLRVAPEPIAAAHTPFLTYGFDERQSDSTVAFLQWEDRRIAFTIAVPNSDELYVAQMRQELLGWPGFNYQNWQTAAQFCADHKINLEEALIWAGRAIDEPFRAAALGRVDFSTLQTKAAVLQALGRQDVSRPRTRIHSIERHS
jgi:hypothetical protein